MQNIDAARGINPSALRLLNMVLSWGGTSVNIKLLAASASHFALKRLLGPFWLRRIWLEKTQWLNEEQLRAIQLNRLQKLVRHCYRTVPFYRQLMEKMELVPDDIRTLDDIRLFPIITKHSVLADPQSFLSIKYPGWLLHRAHTGGTTGTPMYVHRNPFSIGVEHAFVRRQWDWAGIGFRDRCAYLTGRVIVPPQRTEGRLYVYDPFLKELILSTYHLSAHTAQSYLEIMQKYRIRALVGYPSSVFLLARTCLDLGMDIKLHAVLTSSETITDTARNTISRAFGCQVFDFYGAAERVCYIHTCEHGSYHVIPEYGLTELVPEGHADDCRCRVIATGFWNFAMPLIRYDTGDVVVKSNERCPCGRACPVVRSIEGRQGDIIRTPSQRQLGCALLGVLCGTGNVVESQIIQNQLDRITIEYVPSPRFSAEDLNSFQKLISIHLPEELKVELKQVHSIQKTRSGKLRQVVSNLGA